MNEAPKLELVEVFEALEGGWRGILAGLRNTDRAGAGTRRHLPVEETR